MTWWQISLFVYLVGALVMAILVGRTAQQETESGCSAGDVLGITIFCTLLWPIMVYGVLERR